MKVVEAFEKNAREGKDEFMSSCQQIDRMGNTVEKRDGMEKNSRAVERELKGKFLSGFKQNKKKAASTLWRC